MLYASILGAVPADDPYSILGLPGDADADAVRLARRLLAKRVHPDVGGDAEQMRRINDAAVSALAEIEQRLAPSPPGGRLNRRQTGRSTRFSAASVERSNRRYGKPRAVSDNPSFVIEVLPVIAYQGLVVVLAALGTIVDDNPPYYLEANLVGQVSGWCACELVPEAGATTVGLTYATADVPSRSVDDLRDLIVDRLNMLDWGELNR